MTMTMMDKRTKVRIETINTLIATFGDEDGRLGKELEMIITREKREKTEKALETLKATYEEILLNEEDEVERETLLSFYRRQIEETTAKLQNIK